MGNFKAATHVAADLQCWRPGKKKAQQVHFLWLFNRKCMENTFNDDNLTA